MIGGRKETVTREMAHRIPRQVHVAMYEGATRVVPDPNNAWVWDRFAGTGSCHGALRAHGVSDWVVETDFANAGVRVDHKARRCQIGLDVADFDLSESLRLIHACTGLLPANLRHVWISFPCTSYTMTQCNQERQGFNFSRDQQAPHKPNSHLSKTADRLLGHVMIPLMRAVLPAVDRSK